MLKKLLIATAMLLGFAGACLAQPAFGPGPVPNPWFQNGNTVYYPGLLQIPATGSGSIAHLNLAPGSAPASPNNGDLWYTDDLGLFAQINGSTIELTGAGSGSFTNSYPLAVTFPSPGIVNYGLNYDTNFTNNGSNALALSNAPSGDLLANAGTGAAEPVATNFSTWFDRTIGGGAAANGMLPVRSGGTWGNKLLGTSVNDPGTGTLEGLLPPQTPTLTGNAYAMAQADLFKETRFANSGTNFTVTLPPSTTTGLINGSRVVTNNIDSAATMTVDAGAGTQVNGGSTVSVGPTRSVAWIYDATGGTPTWRSTYNGINSLLSQNNLSDLANVATARANLGLGTAATQNTGTSGATLGLLNGSNTYSGIDTFSGTLNCTGTCELGGTAFGPLATLTQGGAATFVGNPTASAANQTNFTLSSLSSDTSPNMTLDLIPIWNHTTGTLQNVTASQLFGSVGNVTSVGNSDGTLIISPTTGSVVASVAAIGAPGGRLTLTSHMPVMTASVTSGGVSTLYYDAYVGGYVPVYNGTVYKLDAITLNEMEDLIPTSGTGVANSGGVFDEWYYDDSGSPVICHATNGSGGGWASDSGSPSNQARGTGYSQLDNHTRPFVTNANAIADCYNGSTNKGSIPANEATYLGTFATDLSNAGKIDFTLGTAASGGGAADIGLWNYYNRVPLTTSVVDNGTVYTYTTTNTVRGARASTTNRITAVWGVAEDSISASYGSITETSAAGGDGAAVGVCLDTATSFSGTPFEGVTQSAVILFSSSVGTLNNPPLVGVHFFQACEASLAATATFNYQSSPYNLFFQTLTGSWRY